MTVTVARQSSPGGADAAGLLAALQAALELAGLGGRVEATLEDSRLGVRVIDPSIDRLELTAVDGTVATTELGFRASQSATRDTTGPPPGVTAGFAPKSHVGRLFEDARERIFVELVEVDGHRETTDELRDQAVALEVLRLDPLHDVAFLPLDVLTGETYATLADPTLDDLFEPIEGSPANEENVAGVDLDVFLLWMLAPTTSASKGL